MLFFKNIIKRDKIRNYIIILVSMLVILCTMECVHLYTKNKKLELLNSVDQRTVIFLDYIDCKSMQNYEIEKCYIENDETIVILKNLNEKKKVEEYFNEEYSLLIFGGRDTEMNTVINLLSKLAVSIIILITIIIMIVELILVKEDFKIFKMLRNIGYSRIKLLWKNIVAINLFYTTIILLSSIIIFIEYLLFNSYIRNLPIVRYFVFTLIIVYIIINIEYIMIYYLFNHSTK